MHARVIIWALLALVVGVSAGYYLGYNGGYDEAVSYFVAVK
jgi:ABC-type dipeptide/oligopeptide/nickel transport system permease subunit